MATVWFVLVAAMLTGYVVLDGFDLGAGVIQMLVARTDAERRLILRAIGPVWDGNEVWLLAGGGTLFFAFPLLYASSFSGFYLPLNVVLWLLILRGIGIEFRLHVANRIWQEFFDAMFALSSALLTIFFGAALANVVRGVPLRPDHYFFEPLWTNFTPGPNAGVLDWYTVLGGVLALVALTVHGALYLTLKMEEEFAARIRGAALMLWPVLALLTVVSLIATVIIRPQVTNNYIQHPIGFVIPAIVAAGLLGSFRFSRRREDKNAFLSSFAYLIAMMVGAAYAQYPSLLRSSNPQIPDITIQNAAAGSYSLTYGVIWWGCGMVIAIGYFVMIYRMFRGKVTATASGHGY